MGKATRKNFIVVLRHGRTCPKMRGTVLRISEQGFQSMLGRPANEKRKNRKIKVKLSEVCLQIVWKFMYLARNDRPDILWAVGKLARSVTRWKQAYDRRQARLISYIHHTSGYRQCCHVDNAVQHCRSRLFPDSDFGGALEDSKATSGGVFVHLQKPNICTNKLNVQKANVSISQFHWIRDHFAGCWFAYGWSICAGLVGFGH